MLVSVTFLFIRSIVLSIYAIRDFKVTTSASADTLVSLSSLRVPLKYLVNNYVARFTFEALVCPIAVNAPRDSSPGVYTPPPVIEASLPSREISYPAGSIARDDPPSSEASSSSATSRLIPELIEGYLSGTILRPGRDTVFVCAFNFPPI